MCPESSSILRVADAMAPISYRVHADTPLAEVVDLMARRELHAVPVVGRDYEVLGIVTSGDVLKALLPRSGPEPGSPDALIGRAEGLVARDVMTRSVLCVSEDQDLIDAATMMVHRDVEQLPVVRESQLVGFITRDVVLRRLCGS